jgi:hypothetical protein
MQYGVDIISCGMIYKPSFMKTGSGVQNLVVGDTQTYRKQG